LSSGSGRRFKFSAYEIIKRNKNESEVNPIEESLYQAKEEAPPGDPGKTGEKPDPSLVHGLTKNQVVRHA